MVTRNHHSLPLFHYERASAAITQPVAAAPPAPGRALASLLPEEDFRAQEAAELQAEADRAEAAQAESRQQTIEEIPPKEPAPDENPAAEAEAPRLVSSRHAAGAVASLLDALDEAPAADPTPAPPAPAAEPTPEPDEEPAAPALYYNPITAPAPTANDQANRAAEIALRKQRRASMAADTAAQRDALSGLFPGAAGKPTPAKVS
ncbi:hypothetical protein ACFQ48_18590 [Hymenobacter caeli]|uniref:Chemotaxis protein histidine kinase CheA n=1 Tax=Hymenobacter caeli TaxID=2735894 RepID=A0ABX2FUU8_9BACT|nr:hypothetical protein [Hymenobacter caeli]NRT20956.1 chemotaxis protein histidine kinase CheA [Hymenobacter caeli]